MCKRICLYVAAAVLGIGTAFVVSTFLTIITVEGECMEPEIKDGSRVLVDKSVLLRDDYVPETGIVMAYNCDVYSEEGNGSVLFGRVAAHGGDTVQIKDNILYVNGRPYDDYMQQPANMDETAKLKLDEDEIFVLCDDRRFSMDSRNEAVGILELDDCIGRVCFK